MDSSNEAGHQKQSSNDTAHNPDHVLLGGFANEPQENNIAVQIEPLEHASSSTHLSGRESGQPSLSPNAEDIMMCMIRELIRRDSRFSSLSSNCSSNIGDTPVTPSTATSLASTVDGHRCPTSLLLPEPRSEDKNEISLEVPLSQSFHRASLTDKVYDYSHRVNR